MPAERQNVPALSVGSEWNEYHGANSPLSYHHLRRLSDKMKLPKFLHIQKLYRRTRNETRSEIGPIEAQSEADLATPRPTESTPDLRIGVSTFPTPGPLAPNDQESNSMQLILSRTIHPSNLFM